MRKEEQAFHLLAEWADKEIIEMQTWQTEQNARNCPFRVSLMRKFIRFTYPHLIRHGLGLKHGIRTSGLEEHGDLDV